MDSDSEDLRKVYVETLSRFGTRLSMFPNPCTVLPISPNCTICLETMEVYYKIADTAKAQMTLVGSKSKEYGISNRDSVFETKECKHYFHLDCAKQIIMNQPSTKYFECPVCRHIQGQKIGNQPETGEMKIAKECFDLPGHKEGWTFKNGKHFGRCQGTIVVEYKFWNGVQGKYHPRPGAPYYAYNFPRKAYFPATSEGIHVVRLLKVAFDRRLVFTVGQSSTNQKDNAIVWNGIHHKTKISGAAHGYPDPQYLDRIQKELKSFGVTEHDLKDAANIAV